MSAVPSEPDRDCPQCAVVVVSCSAPPQRVARFGDPEFRYHVALVQLWGLVALRLADADAIPLNYEPYAERIIEFAEEVRR